MTSPLAQKLGQLAAHPFSVILLLVAVTLAAYWPVTSADFINYDDTDYVKLNLHVQKGLTWENVAWAFRTDFGCNWHPLTWISHMIDVDLFGKSPKGPHCVNLGLHVINSSLLLFLMLRMTGALWRSALVAALFALHPLHVESVAWVAERKDLLSTMFWALSLLSYVNYVAGARDRTLSRGVWYALALAMFALGLMCKPMLVTLPCLLFLLDFWPLQRFPIDGFMKKPRIIARLVLEKAPFFILTTASCIVTSWAQQKAMQSLTHISLLDRAENAMVSYARYLGKAFWPVDMALPYVHPGIWPAGQVVLASLLLGCLSAGALACHRKWPFCLTGWFWYLGTLVPTIGLVQVGIQAMADRYTYVPLIGIFIVVAWGLAGFAAALRIPSAATSVVAVLMLLSCGALTRRQAGYWVNGETLFKHAATVTKDNFIAFDNVGGVLFESGRLDEAMNYYQESARINPFYPESLNSIGAILATRGSDEAIEWFRRALAVQPTHADALFNLGNALAKQGQDDEAIDCFRASLKSKPENYEAMNNLGNVLMKMKRFDEAAVEYRAALKLNPDGAPIHRNLGEVLAAKGRLDEAILQYQQALMTTNDPGVHYSIGMTFAIQGKWDEAIAHFKATLMQTPTNAEAQYNLGYAYRIQGRLDEAAARLEEAVRLKPGFALAHYNLGCVLADQGKREEALGHLREAVHLQPDYLEAQQKLRLLGDRIGE